jgi:hypothetical protein
VISNKRSKKISGINEFFIIFLVTTNNKSQANLNTNTMSTIKGTQSDTVTTMKTAAGISSKFSQANQSRCAQIFDAYVKIGSSLTSSRQGVVIVSLQLF